MMNLLTVRSPDQFFPRLEKTLGKPVAIPAEVDWAVPYMRQVERLNHDLYESRQRASQQDFGQQNQWPPDSR